MNLRYGMLEYVFTIPGETAIARASENLGVDRLSPLDFYLSTVVTTPTSIAVFPYLPEDCPRATIWAFSLFATIILVGYEPVGAIKFIDEN